MVCCMDAWSKINTILLTILLRAGDMLRVTSLHTPSREQPRFTSKLGVTTLRSGFDKHFMSERHGNDRSSRASHERRRPIGPSAFTGELGTPGSSSSRLPRRDNTRYHPSFFSPAIHPVLPPGQSWGPRTALYAQPLWSLLTVNDAPSWKIRSPSWHAHLQRTPRHRHGRRAGLHPIAFSRLPPQH